MSTKEFDRQYRVARQTVGMHARLRDRYAFRVRLLRCVLIAGSAIFCATAFAGDDLFGWIGIAPTSGRIILKIASLASFVVTLIMLVAGWEAAAAKHGDAVKRFVAVVAAFRRARDRSPEIPPEAVEELHRLYLKTCDDSAPIDGRYFASLKARYLLDVLVSKVLDRAPGCPPVFIRLTLRMRSIRRGLAKAWEIPLEDNAAPTSKTS